MELTAVFSQLLARFPVMRLASRSSNFGRPGPVPPQATAAPSLAARTEMARPLPIGGSGSGHGRVPAPTTSTRRPVSRPRPGAEPVASAERHDPPTSARRPAAAARRTRSAGTRSACSTRTATPAPPSRRRRGSGARHRRLLVQAARVTELAGHRVDGPFVVRLERRILAAPDRVHHRAGDAVLARHRRVRPPLELRLPPRADRDDGDLRQPPLIDVPNRSVAPSEDSRRPAPGAVTNALNGPARPPSAVTTWSPRRSTMLSHSCWPSAPAPRAAHTESGS